MSNVYLKVTIEKNWHSQNFNFLSLKEVWEQNCVWFFHCFNSESQRVFKTSLDQKYKL